MATPPERSWQQAKSPAHCPPHGSAPPLLDVPLLDVPVLDVPLLLPAPLLDVPVLDVPLLLPAPPVLAPVLVPTGGALVLGAVAVELGAD
ncbi:MAG: hypothetical protein ABSC94_01335 [Polyangiaceae bacterium]